MKTIAILHPHGGMGDLLLSYPVIQAFAEAHPESRILYVTPPGLEDVVRFHPGVYEVFSLRPGIFSALSLSKKLRDWKTDVACMLWTTGRLAWCVRKAGIPIRIGQAGRMFYSFLFTHQVRVRSANGDTDSHWVECLLDYPRAVGLNPKNKTITLFLPDSAEEEIEGVLESQGLSLQTPMVAMHCGKGEDVLRRGWPLELFAQAADEVAEKGFAVVFTGSAQEISLVESIRRIMRGKSYSLAGRTDFVTLAAFLRKVRVMICPDSGPMHVAAAAGTPVVAIFAMQKDFPKRWAPWGARHKILRPDHFSCRPWCTKESCPDFRCYREISAGEIAKAVENLLEVGS